MVILCPHKTEMFKRYAMCMYDRVASNFRKTEESHKKNEGFVFRFRFVGAEFFFELYITDEYYSGQLS